MAKLPKHPARIVAVVPRMLLDSRRVCALLKRLAFSGQNASNEARNGALKSHDFEEFGGAASG
jgi:hypothetical protein